MIFLYLPYANYYRLMMIGPFVGDELQGVVDRLMERWLNRDFQRMLDLRLIVTSFIWPMTMKLLDYLCTPYFIARLLGLFITSYRAKTLLVRLSFLSYFAARVSFLISDYIHKNLVKWYNDLRDSRYLIGTELTNCQ